jgi:hypothetical protein
MIASLPSNPYFLIDKKKKYMQKARKINKMKTLVTGMLSRALGKPYKCRPVATFIVPDQGDKVDSGLRLSYWPASLCSLAGRYDSPLQQESTLSPQLGTMNLATGDIYILREGVQHILCPNSILQTFIAKCLKKI